MALCGVAAYIVFAFACVIDFFRCRPRLSSQEMIKMPIQVDLDIEKQFFRRMDWRLMEVIRSFDGESDSELDDCEENDHADDKNDDWTKDNMSTICEQSGMWETICEKYCQLTHEYFEIFETDR